MDVHFTRHCTKKWSFPLRISSVNLTKIYARTKFTRTARKACTKNRNFFVFSCINFGLTSIKLTTLNNKRSILTHFWHEYVWYGTRKIPPWSIPPGEFPPIKLAPDNLPSPNLTLEGGGGRNSPWRELTKGGIFRTPFGMNISSRINYFSFIFTCFHRI